MYGPECAGCGETDEVTLTLDHVYGDGAEHRRQRKRSQHGIYLDALDADDPLQFRILCMNCQFRAKAGKRLPHDRRR
jgi:hypothetical protein